MLITSSKYKRLYISKEPIKEACPNCLKKDCLHLELTNKVSYVYGFPFYPSDKRAQLSCTFCLLNFSVNQFPQYKNLADNLLKNTSKKWYNYFGFTMLLLLISSIVYLFFVAQNEDSQNERFHLQALEPNDVIFYKIDDKITTMKVSRIQNDTIFVFENKLSTNKNAYSIDSYVNYSTKETYYLRSELEEKIKQEKIINIY